MAEEIIGLWTTMAGLSKTSKEQGRILNNGNITQASRLKHILNEENIKTGILDEKKNKYQTEFKGIFPKLF